MYPFQRKSSNKAELLMKIFVKRKRLELSWHRQLKRFIFSSEKSRSTIRTTMNDSKNFCKTFTDHCSLLVVLHDHVLYRFNYIPMPVIHVLKKILSTRLKQRISFFFFFLSYSEVHVRLHAKL